jgi:putative Holliday junction resolvase
MVKILGIDYGERRIGLAIAEKEIKIAHPHSIIPSDDEAIPAIAEVIANENVTKVIIGLPRSLDGTEGPQAAAVRDFADKLKTASGEGVDFIFQDERLSSKQADNILIGMDKKRVERRDVADAHQAAIILQSYLDSYGE